MIEFNSDGSIKLPSKILKNKAENEQKMKNTRCIKIEKEVLSDKSPKSCVLHITLSEAFPNGDLVERIYSYFQKDAETPSKLVRINDHEWDIELGTSFRRCSECHELIYRFKSHLEDSTIIDKGNCGFEPRVLY